MWAVGDVRSTCPRAGRHRRRRWRAVTRPASVSDWRAARWCERWRWAPTQSRHGPSAPDCRAFLTPRRQCTCRPSPAYIDVHATRPLTRRRHGTRAPSTSNSVIFQLILALHWRVCCHSNETVHWLQIRPTVHNYRAPLPFPKLHPGPCSSVGMRRGTDRYIDTQTVVINIHFASATPHAKYLSGLTNVTDRQTYRISTAIPLSTIVVKRTGITITKSTTRKKRILKLEKQPQNGFFCAKSPL